MWKKPILCIHSLLWFLLSKVIIQWQVISAVIWPQSHDEMFISSPFIFAVLQLYIYAP